MIDYAMTFADGGYQVDTDGHDSLLSNIILSICVKQGSLFSFPTFGSRMHEITKITDGNLQLAHDYCVEALKWLVTIGRLASVEVQAERDPKDASRINVFGEAVKSNGETVPFTVYYPVV